MGEGRIQSYRDLIAWQRAMEFAVECHRFATALPRSEQFELAAQIRRAASSVPFNIAEGFGLGTDKAFAKHLRISRGSTFEAQTGIEIAQRLGLTGPHARLQELAEETVRLIQGLIISIHKRGGAASDSED
jgi:four helix bundle protein